MYIGKDGNYSLSEIYSRTVAHVVIEGRCFKANLSEIVSVLTTERQV